MESKDWPRCLLWDGWLPELTSRSTGSPWAVAASDLAGHNLDKALGPRTMPAIWWMMFLFTLTYGRMVEGNRYLILKLRERGPSSTHQPSLLTVVSVDMLRILMASWKAAPTSSRGIIGPVQSVQRAEYRGVILALQAYSGIHIGIDNLSVLRAVAKLIDQGVTSTPASPGERWRPSRPRLKDMLHKPWLTMVMSDWRTSLVMMARLYCEKAVRPHLRSRRPLDYSMFPVSFGQEIRHGCQFLRGLFRSLATFLVV